MKLPWLAALALALLIAGARPAAAQEPAPAAPAPTAQPTTDDEAPEPIPLADIASEADGLTSFLRQVERALRPTPEQRELIEGFEAAHEAVMARAQRTAALVSDPPTLIAIEDEERHWRRTLEELTRWRLDLTAELVELGDTLVVLGSRRATWTRTGEKARAEGAPPVVLSRVDDTIRTLDEGISKVTSRQSELLELQGRIVQLEGQTADAVESLAAARTTVRSSLFRRDSPALWRVSELGERAERTGSSIQRSAGERRSNLLDYVDTHFDRLVALVVLFLVLAALGLRMRGKLHRGDDPELQGFAIVFDRPWSSALLVTLIAGPLVHATAPRSFDDLLTLLLLVPLMRLLPALVRPAWRPSVYLLALFMVFDVLRTSLVVEPVGRRLILLCETGVFTAAMAWLVWSAPKRRIHEDLPWSGVLGGIAQASTFALGLATLANLLGYLNLARLLGAGILNAGFIAAIVYGGVRVLQGAVYALLHNRTARRLHVLGRHESALVSWANRLLGALAALLWLNFTLESFHVREAFLNGLSSVLTEEVTLGALSISLGDVTAFVLTLLASIVLARIIRAILEEDVLTRIRTARGVGHAIAAIVQYTLVLLGFLAAISAAGMELNNLALLASAFGVGIGFGLQDVVRNFISGLILLFERPIQVGDSIVVGTVEGRVTRIGIRSSTVRTWPGAEVIVPNGQLITREVANWTLTDQERRIDLQFFVSPDEDPERVLAVLNAQATAHPNALAQPPPAALFVAFAPESLNFELRVWVRFENFLAARSELGVTVLRALREAGIRLSAPQRDIRIVPTQTPTARTGSVTQDPQIGRDSGGSGRSEA